MLCQNCNQNEATVQLTKVINNKKNEQFLCEECAKEQGALYDFNNPFDFGDPFDINIGNFFKGMIDYPMQKEAPKKLQEGQKCEKCNMSLSEFSKIGKLGCSNCYKAFSQSLEPLFKRIHGSIFHGGKIPQRAESSLKIKRQLGNLKTELKMAIEQEKFEKAAEIRDKIRALENEGK